MVEGRLSVWHDVDVLFSSVIVKTAVKKSFCGGLVDNIAKVRHICI